jgi:hypothetical protein
VAYLNSAVRAGQYSHLGNEQIFDFHAGRERASLAWACWERGSDGLD